MHFGVAGTVLACCRNGTNAFGDIRIQSLRSIWDGSARAAMASALADGRYPIGCELCEVDHGIGNRAATPAPSFDRFSDEAARWPQQMEFTLSNRCNLACIHCNGENSSTIRARREKLPPLPMPYGEDFFAQLPPFLEQVEVLAFLGGEPFLMPEARRIWEMLLDRRLHPEVQVTTNATVWNRDVERYLHGLKMDLTVSIDGATQATYEAIRVGARYERVIEIRDRMLAATRRYGGFFQLNYCLLASNWQELGLFLRQADDLGVTAQVIPVLEPAEHSLFALAEQELAPIVARLDAEETALSDRLGPNRTSWDAAVGMLRDHLSRIGSTASRETRLTGIRSDGIRAAARSGTRAESELRAWAGREAIAVSIESGLVREVDAPAWAEPLRPDEWVGRPMAAIEAAVSERLGAIEYLAPESHPEDAGALVRSDSVIASTTGPIRFRSVYIQVLGRLLIASPDAIDGEATTVPGA